MVNAEQELERSPSCSTPSRPCSRRVNTALILGIGGLRVMDGSLTLGGLVAFQLLMAAFIAPVNRLVSLGGKLQTVEGDMNRLDDVLRYRLDPTAGSGSGELPPAGDARPAGRLPGAARRLLRLQPARSAADRRLRSDPEARLAGRPGRRLGERQVDDLPAW